MSLRDANKSRIERKHHKEAIELVTKEETARLNVNIPLSKHKQFRIRALERNEELKVLIEKWIDLYLAGKMD